MKTLFSLLTATALLFIMACAPASDSNSEATDTAQVGTKKGLTGQSAVSDDMSAKNILQVAIGSKDHTTLVAGVQATHLENVLVNAGPITVFAATNTAFDALPEGTLETLLQDENLPTLARIIKFHAAPGNYPTRLLKDGQRLFMASGHYLEIKVEGDTYTIGGAKILGSVKASNGIVHVIDAVLLPPD
jgi:uncharacterized surface protein with fasciclin (FAS1) repeats